VSKLSADLIPAPENRSNVMDDLWHILKNLEASSQHFLAKKFNSDLSDQLYEWDPEDVARVEEILRRRGSTLGEEFKARRDWCLKRVRRRALPIMKQLAVLDKLLTAYSTVPDVKRDDLLLFSKSALSKNPGVRKSIELGYLQDPKGRPLYQVIGIDSEGLTLYAGRRGTSGLEGAVHSKLSRKIPNFNYGIETLDCYLVCFVNRHNLHVSVGILSCRASLNV